MNQNSKTIAEMTINTMMQEIQKGSAEENLDLMIGATYKANIVLAQLKQLEEKIATSETNAGNLKTQVDEKTKELAAMKVELDNAKANECKCDSYEACEVVAEPNCEVATELKTGDQ